MEILFQNYKHKIQNCRGMLLDKLRGSLVEKDLCSALTDIYKSMFNYSEEIIDDEEYELLEELKRELVQEELEWYGLILVISNSLFLKQYFNLSNIASYATGVVVA